MNKKLMTPAALMITCVTLASLSQADPRIVTPHVATHASGKNEAVAECVRQIEQYWPQAAKLMLRHRAQVAKRGDERVLRISGWVWRSGERALVQHECGVAQGAVVALKVYAPDGDLIAQR